jgi:DNA-binding IclR family transcriptional regulator
VLDLLNVLAHDVGEVRVADVARIFDIGTSTASRLLMTLHSHGFVVRDDATGLHRLGPAALSLAGAALNQQFLYREARVVATGLVAEFQLGANVAERQRDQLFYVISLDGPRSPRPYTLLGQRGPLHATGLGKALLCDHSPEGLAQLFPQPLKAYTARTIVDLDTLATELAAVRACGYAVEQQELAMGRACVAAPIRGADGAPVAAISLSGPVSLVRLPDREQELGTAVVEAADRLSSVITPPYPRPYTTVTT